MLKRILTLMVMAMFASQATAAIECYDLANGENGKGSRNSVIIPPFSVQGSRMFHLSVVNIGARNLNVSLKLINENGEVYEPVSGVSFDGNFSSSNDPIKKLDGTGAALLSSFKIGKVLFDDNSSNMLTGILSWQADACLGEATLLPNIDVLTNVTDGTNRFSTHSITVNGGNPF